MIYYIGEKKITEVKWKKTQIVLMKEFLYNENIKIDNMEERLFSNVCLVNKHLESS